MYNSPLVSDAVERMEYLGATHLLLTRVSREEFGIDSVKFSKSSCFDRFIIGDSEVLARKCNVIRKY